MFIIHSFIILVYSLPYRCFTWLTSPGLYRVTTCREGELTPHHIHTFLTTQGHGEPPRMRDQFIAWATSEKTWTWMTIHAIHASIHSNKANMKGWLWRPNDIRESCRLKASWHLSYRWGKNRKNLTQETSPDRGSNSGPLRDRRACYRLLHSGGL